MERQPFNSDPERYLRGEPTVRSTVDSPSIPKGAQRFTSNLSSFAQQLLPKGVKDLKRGGKEQFLLPSTSDGHKKRYGNDVAPGFENSCGVLTATRGSSMIMQLLWFACNIKSKPKDMASGIQSQSVAAFHLSYNMLLNQLQGEDGDTKNLLSNSFFQLHANYAIADIQVQLYEDVNTGCPDPFRHCPFKALPFRPCKLKPVYTHLFSSPFSFRPV
ncbi:Uncharacterized protein Rs2_40934 [Raphanus sativus]|nr:Uncharacterized protein Rs2_40934 [Raphanus sativus]